MATSISSSRVITVLKALSFCALWLLSLQLTGVLQGLMPPALRACIYGILGSGCALLLTWLYLKAEKKTFSDIGLTLQLKTPLRFLLGVAIGAAIFAAMTTLLLLFGQLHLSYTGASLPAVMLSTITLFWLALMEEIAFRSYPLLKLKAKLGLPWAQLIMAVAFASYHFAIGWNLQTVFMGPFVWAFVYGLAAIRSRGIALPTGLHLAMNVGQTLSGMRGGTSAIWKIDYSSANHPNTQLILILLHATVFLIAAGLTWFWRKSA